MFAIKKNIFLIKNLIFRRQTLKQYSNLLLESKMSETERQKLLYNRVKNIITHAFNSSDFYKKKFEEYNFNPEDFLNLEGLKRIPILTKNELRENNLLIKYQKMLETETDKKQIKTSNDQSLMRIGAQDVAACRTTDTA